MNSPVKRILVAFVTLVLAAFAASQTAGKPHQADNSPLLKINEPITRTLTGSDSHSYRLRASMRKLVKVVVVQKGVDVSVQALDSSRKQIAIADDSLGRMGPQDVEFLTNAEGDYLIRVAARPEEIGGKYEIVFVTARDATPHDRVRVTARAHISAGNSYRARPSADSNRKVLAEYEKALALFTQLADTGLRVLPPHKMAANVELLALEQRIAKGHG